MSAGGKSGDITLEATLIYEDIADLESYESASAGGNITLRATQNIETQNFGRISASSGATGGMQAILR